MSFKCCFGHHWNFSTNECRRCTAKRVNVRVPLPEEMHKPGVTLEAPTLESIARENDELRAQIKELRSRNV